MSGHGAAGDEMNQAGREARTQDLPRIQPRLQGAWSPGFLGKVPAPPMVTAESRPGDPNKMRLFMPTSEGKGTTS